MAAAARAAKNAEAGNACPTALLVSTPSSSSCRLTSNVTHSCDNTAKVGLPMPRSRWLTVEGSTPDSVPRSPLGQTDLESSSVDVLTQLSRIAHR